MTRTLYLVRHGRTLFNEKRIIQGWSDSPLTAEGEQQAARLGRYFDHEGIAFDHVYTSTAARTHATTELITSVPFTRDPGLREWFFGAFEGERISLMPARPWGDFYLQFGGESQDQVRSRVCAALDAIMRRPGHERVLAVSHGSACREFMERWQASAAGTYRDVPGNCSVMRYAFDPATGVFSLEDVLEQTDIARLLGEQA